MSSARKATKTKRRPLRQDDKIRVSRLLQVYLLSEIARIGKPEKSDLIFHGGTNIAATHQSPRWSEDLDFIASPEMINKLSEMRSQVEKSIQRKIKSDTDIGGSLVVENRFGSDGDPEIGTVDRWLVRWEHPDIMGVVKVKAEFYVTESDMISPFRTRISYPQMLDVRASSALPAADMVMIWADKVVAMACRPVLKHRDIYDMGFLGITLQRDNLKDEDLKVALSNSMRIYGKTPSDISEGLDRDIVKLGSEDREAFDADMKRWFSGSEYKKFIDERHLDVVFEEFSRQISNGRRMTELLVQEADPESRFSVAS